MDTLTITSRQNPKLKQAAALWKRRERDNTDCFLIEGFRELQRAAASDIFFCTLFVCPDFFLGTNENQLIHSIKEKGAQVIYCTPHVFKALSYRDRPDGLIAVAKQFHLSLEALMGDFFVVAEGIEKPGNLGTILRSSDAANVDAVIVADRKTDIHNPNVVRASVGTLFTVPTLEGTNEEVYAWLKKKDAKIVASTPSAEIDFTNAPLSYPLAIILGTEQYGLSSFWMEKADVLVKIPMHGVADSLNVAMAATLLLYEARRQRNLSR